MLDKTTLLALQKEVREVNELNGWFDRERPFSADIALLHSEVSEFFQALIRLDGADNEGEELADTLIRLLDTAERYDFDVTRDDVKPHPALAMSPQSLQLLISWAYEGYRDKDTVLGRDVTEISLNRLRMMLFDVAERCGVDLIREAQIKLHRNRQRGYRHGGKVE